ncbi:MAG: tripartite tricarboxylate transporter substrate binding protein [Gracilibacteraceae bacterium]|jgi:tripartite-type tricarboxylate transporter receptor subunit TctC|nr:tripartite tricarboxylate transporter substrate binding protein [Gracilibacteraceae bacterium]
MKRKLKNSCALIFALLLLSMLFSACGQPASSPEGPAAPTSASDYPTKPVRVMTPFDPGAASDMQLRIISKYAKPHLGVELVVENVPGAGGQVGWNQFSTAGIDSYYISCMFLPHVIVMPLVNDTEFSIDTFDPIALWNTDPSAIAVANDSPYQSLQDLIDDAKSRPGEITIGSGGVYGAHHLLIMAIEAAAGVTVTHLPQASMNGVLSAMYGGHVDVGSGNTTDFYQNKDNVRVLAVAGKERSPFFPDVPTFEELGYEGIVLSVDRGLAVRKGTPEDVRQKLEDDFMALFADPDFVAEAEQAGIVLTPMRGAELQAELPERIDFLVNLLRETGALKE